MFNYHDLTQKLDIKFKNEKRVHFDPEWKCPYTLWEIDNVNEINLMSAIQELYVQKKGMFS